MANIASGYVSIESTDKEFLEDLKNKINDGPFSYGGPVDIMDKDHGLDAGFTGRWSCEDAWVFFEDLMANADYAFQQALIDSEISGSESEEGAREAREISKQSGEALITRKDVSDEREWEEEEEEEEEVAVITDKTETLAAVKNEGAALEHASDELKADREVVMAAVKNKGGALEYASDELK
ncbi:uncharacterized protein METZ01_LOCUS357978, partial [marine metagenome]